MKISTLVGSLALGLIPGTFFSSTSTSSVAWFYFSIDFYCILLLSPTI